MTLFEKEQIRRMRGEGVSYARIAAFLSLSENTVKSYCKRNNLGGVATVSASSPSNQKRETFDFCKNCGESIQQRQGIKPRKFCSDQCRITWWNSHLDKVSHKAMYHLKCKGCGRTFDSYGNKNRKYCSHACYIQERFSKGSQLEVRDQDDTRAIRA